ncbi:hypothetical protein C8R48DRAFT_676785 [Suillus tomentosus]|nr:hypothetical protein C8R48DRAFT_676785 [Suillus tomentosus]
MGPEKANSCRISKKGEMGNIIIIMIWPSVLGFRRRNISPYLNADPSGRKKYDEINKAIRLQNYEHLDHEREDIESLSDSWPLATSSHSESDRLSTSESVELYPSAIDGIFTCSSPGHKNLYKRVCHAREKEQDDKRNLTPCQLLIVPGVRSLDLVRGILIAIGLRPNSIHSP